MSRAPDLSGIALDGRYELHALIGEGTFGRVYRGRDRRLARWVAVKVIKPWWAEDPDWAKSFEREAQLLASISDPGIIQVFDVGAAPEGLYYVAELVEGESLAHRLRRGCLSPAEACEVAMQLSRALGRAHSQRMVHRDVKPANVLIDRDGRTKVGDFGVARLAGGSSDAAAATIAGTPGYMAPEQASGEIATPATDVYGVGIVLYEMLAGHPPFQGRSAVELALRHLNDPPPPLPIETPEPLARIVERALAKCPADRYSDGHELATVLSRVGAAVHTEHAEINAGSRLPAMVALAEGPPDTSSVTEPMPSEGVAASSATSKRPDNGTATRVGDPRSPRRNFNPSERRQRIALLILAVLLAVGMAVVALVLAPGHLRVPNLRGMTKTGISSLAHRDNFHAAFDGRYSSKPRDTALSQTPEPGTRVGEGATVTVVLSRGPRPVAVPEVVGSSAASAKALLGRLKLHSTVTEVPAPGVNTGTIVRQSPSSGANIAPGSTVELSAAEAPRLRSLTSLSGDGDGRSVPFRIRGRRWEIVYSMGYEGVCTFVVFCSGPSAKVANVGNSASIDQFDLGEGSDETRIFKSGPGVYELSVSPGSDTARWKIQVYDYY